MRLRAVLSAFPLLFLSCGHLGPGTAFVGGPSSYVSPGRDGPRQGRHTDGARPVYDDKGCANMSGEGGAKIQAGCRSGR